MSKTAQKAFSRGGRIPPPEQQPLLKILRAYSGLTTFEETQWINLRASCWIVDRMNQGTQNQQVQSAKPYVRSSGVVVLYAPGCRYSEHQEKGKRINESYVLFELGGGQKLDFLKLLGRARYCHFLDPTDSVGLKLERLSSAIFYRRPGYALQAHGLLSCLLAELLQSDRQTECLRLLGTENRSAPQPGLQGKIEELIRSRIAEPLTVNEMARFVGMSDSAFAHHYPKVSGETPHRTVLRLKIEEAKRLIIEEQLRVKETAERLGFSSEFHFSKAFKRIEGVSPRDYPISLLRKNGQRIDVSQCSR